MLNWFLENLSTILVGTAVMALAAAAVQKMICSRSRSSECCGRCRECFQKDSCRRE